MASQYLSYLIIFSLGLTMVIMVGDLFSGITSDLRSSSAQPELDSILIEIKDVIMDATQTLQSVNTGEITIQFSLPYLIMEQYSYSVTITTRGARSHYYIVGEIEDFSYETALPLRFDDQWGIFDGIWESHYSYHYLKLQTDEVTLSGTLYDY